MVGINIGSETHYARAFDWRGIEYTKKKAFKFSNSAEGFAEFMNWTRELMRLYDKDKMLPGMEPTGHYWINLCKYLQDCGIKPALVNPHYVKKSKEFDDNSPKKSYHKDPRLIARLVNEGRYTFPYIPEGVYADLRTATNLRFQIEKELIRIKNRIQRWLSIYFPEFKKTFKNYDAQGMIIVLKNAPLPEDIIRQGVDGICSIWREAKLRTCWNEKGEKPV